MDELHYSDIVRIAHEQGLERTASNEGLNDWLLEHGLCLPAVEKYADEMAEIGIAHINGDVGEGDYTIADAFACCFVTGLTLGVAIGAHRQHETQRAVERGRHAYEMLLHHRGNDVATLAWVRTFLNEGGSIWSRR